MELRVRAWRDGRAAVKERQAGPANERFGARSWCTAVGWGQLSTTEARVATAAALSCDQEIGEPQRSEGGLRMEVGAPYTSCASWCRRGVLACPCAGR
jgi:hypothetical protein